MNIPIVDSFLYFLYQAIGLDSAAVSDSVSNIMVVGALCVFILALWLIVKLVGWMFKLVR